MISLIREGNIFAPQPLGIKDILIADGIISGVFEPGTVNISGFQPNEINAKGKLIAPGFVDSHVHILGGGGEGGPATRAPELAVEEAISSGVTTLIGCLGTDSTTRHMESLLAKARALENEGLTTYIFSGSYEIPVVTLTGSVRRDLILIDKVIGAGEIALSDHRSSQPTFEEFSKLAAECRVGGLLGGKAGVLHCHLGDGPRGLDMFFRLIEETEVPSTQLIPTHANRNPNLLKEAFTFIQKGGYVDLTAGENPLEEDLSVPRAIKMAKENTIPLSHLSVSSDSNGSLPVFNKKGALTGLTIATQKSLLANFRFLVKKELLSIEEAIGLFSSNPAMFYRLDKKGKIMPGAEADLLFFDKNLIIQDVIAKGRQMMKEGEVLARRTFRASD